MNFNEKLKMLRKENNMTQEDLAERLDLTRQAITKWELGEGLPDVKNLKLISDIFNVSIDELVKEDLSVKVEPKYKYYLVKELIIDHTKHFDIKIMKNAELNILKSTEEIVKIELLSNENELMDDDYRIIFDDIYNRLDINVKSKKSLNDLTINLHLPEKYIDEIELNSKTKQLSIENLDFKRLEYDGELKYLNVIDSKGKIVLNTTKCDVEAFYNIFDGILEVNTFNSTSRVTLPKGAAYKTILKGKKNKFIDEQSAENSDNIIELNGLNSKLVIIENDK